MGECRESLETFAEEICKLSTWVCESLAEALGLSRDAFIKQLGGGVHQQVVASSYPVPENQPKDTPSSVGFGAHTDLTVINAVVEDENGGAQVWHDDQWMNKRPISVGVSFFLGDPIEVRSRYKDVLIISSILMYTCQVVPFLLILFGNWIPNSFLML